MAKRIVFVYCILGLSFDYLHGREFSSLVEDLTFQATYKIQTFANLRPQSISEIHETYHSGLLSARISQVVHEIEKGSGLIKTTSRKLIYYGEKRRLIEVQGEENDDGLDEQFYLPENGGSSSYDIKRDEDNADENIRVLAATYPLLSRLLLSGGTNELAPQLDLDSYMRRECLELAMRKLHYVCGLSRLLILIECLRDEFKLNETAERTTPHMTRNMAASLYSAKNVRLLSMGQFPVADQVSLDIQVTIPNERKCPSSATLPERFVPLSISLSFEPDIWVMINVFQFDVLGSDEHLSESNQAQSIFMLPVARGLGASLQNLLINEELSDLTDHLSSFSFRARLTGPNWYPTGARIESMFEDPLEMIVVYDSQLRVLAKQTSYPDRSKAVGDSWRLHSSQVVFDAKSGHKYHTMSRNYDSGDQLEVGEEQKWSACVTDLMSSDEVSAMESLGGSEFILHSEGSVFMGMANVRGVDCYVYEKLVDKLPIWLDLIDNNLDGEKYIILYLRASKQANSAYLHDMFRRGDRRTGQLMRVEIRLESAGGRADHFQLDVFSFEWSTHLVNDVPALLDVGRHCLASLANGRHIELDMLFQMEDQLDSKHDNELTKLRQLEDLRQHSVSMALADSYDITSSQQVDLATEWSPSNHLSVQLTVYELTDSYSEVQFVGFSRDLSSNLSPADNRFESISAEHCKWSALHTLEHFDESKVFMFCPHRFKCLLGDERWKPILKSKGQQSHQVKGLLSFEPQLSEQDALASVDVCRVSVVSRIKNSRSSSYYRQPAAVRQIDLEPTLSHLDWLNTHAVKSHLLDLRVDEQHNEQSLRMRLTRLKSKLNRRQPDYQEEPMWPIEGFGFSERQSIEPGQISLTPLSVSNIAQCHQVCLASDRCETYSTCHSLRSHKLTCILSALESRLFDANTMATLRQQVRQIGADDPLIAVNLTVKDGECPVQVQLRKSSLCHLRRRDHSDVYRYEMNSLEPIPAAKFLIYAKSSHECARFCLERNKLINELRVLISQAERSKGANVGSEVRDLRSELLLANGTNITTRPLAEFRQYGCYSFRFSQSSCQLLPLRDHLRLISSSSSLLGKWIQSGHDDDGHRSHAVLSKWLRWFESETPEDWRHQSRGFGFVEMDFYKLDFRLVFSPDKIAPGEPNTTTTIVSKRLEKTSLSECAWRCIELNGCKSFQSIGEESATLSPATCVLYNRAAVDACADHQAGDPESCWHFRLNDLGARILDEQRSQVELEDQRRADSHVMTSLFINISTLINEKNDDNRWQREE